MMLTAGLSVPAMPRHHTPRPESHSTSYRHIHQLNFWTNEFVSSAQGHNIDTFRGASEGRRPCMERDSLAHTHQPSETLRHRDRQLVSDQNTARIPDNVSPIRINAVPTPHIAEHIQCRAAADRRVLHVPHTARRCE